MKSNFLFKKTYAKFFSKYIQKKTNSNPQHCVAEDIQLLEGGVLYGFTGTTLFKIHLYSHL